MYRRLSNLRCLNDEPVKAYQSILRVGARWVIRHSAIRVAAGRTTCGTGSETVAGKKSQSKILQSAAVAKRNLPPLKEVTPETALEIRSTPREQMNLYPLDTFEYEYPGNRIEINFTSSEFTAICPFSDFPDFAVLKLRYTPNRRCIELKSLKLYINSFREVKIFHEHVVNRILEDFVAACDPLEFHIEGDFHLRGNIKTVIHASYVRKANKSISARKQGRLRGTRPGSVS
jgi:7-cyano-7-deazaguanine reductase